MEGKIKALDRELLIKATKTLLYLIPIIGISNHIYVLIYDEYEFDFSGFVNFAEKHPSNLVVAFLIFASLFLFLYFMEQFLLPLIFLATNKGQLDSDIETKEKIGDDYKKVYGLNFLKLSEIPFFRFEMVGDIAFFFIVLILWLLYWNTCTGYIIILVLCLIFIFIARETIILFEPIDESENSQEQNK